jgi:hypothetical protein
MQLELLNIHYRFLAKPTNMIMTLAGSKEIDNGECEEITMEIVIEREMKEELFALSLSDIRQEAIQRARALIDAIE